MTVSTNLLKSNMFKVVLKRAPNIEFFSKSIDLPGVSLSGILIPTPFTNIKEQGDHINFNSLSVTFSVDEEMKNYKEIITWMTEIGFPESYSQYKHNPREVDGSAFSDLDIYLFTSKGNPKHLFSFKNAWPTDLSGININIENTTVTYAECTVTFEYDFFNVS